MLVAPVGSLDRPPRPRDGQMQVGLLLPMLDRDLGDGLDGWLRLLSPGFADGGDFDAGEQLIAVQQELEAAHGDARVRRAD